MLLAGCGGGDHGPRLASRDAAPLLSLAHRIAHEGACAQARDIPRLRERANALVNRHGVPDALQEPLLSGVAALEEETPTCVPSVPAAATTPTPAPAPAPAPAPPRPHGHDHPHSHPHGHGKHKR